ncbi:hypothetical protein MRX96_019104 [Rhipicephalus microplus]
MVAPPPSRGRGAAGAEARGRTPASAKCTLAGRRRPAPGHYLHLPRRAIDGRPRTPLRGPLRAATGLPAHSSLVLSVRPHAIDRAVASPACLATDALGCRLSAVAFSRFPSGPGDAFLPHMRRTRPQSSLCSGG